jgi:hypothetical protein
MAEGAWQAAAGQTDRPAEVEQQGSADSSEQQALMEDVAVRTMGDNVADLWFEDCQEEPEELQQHEKTKDGWREWHQKHPELDIPAQVKRVPGSIFSDENHAGTFHDAEEFSKAGTDAFSLLHGDLRTQLVGPVWAWCSESERYCAETTWIHHDSVHTGRLCQGC